MAAQSKQTRVAIIGTGGIAAAHAQGLKSLAERVEVVGAVDVDRARVEEFCTQQGFDKNIAYTDTARMLAEQRPRLVNVCTPPGLHCDQSIQAMEAGAWVLCEKPLCASLEELDRLAEAERRTGQYVSSVYQWRFGSGGRHLKKLVEAGSLGKPLVGMCNTTWYRGDDYYAVPWRGKWATELGGPTMIHGIHAMDFFLWVMGDWAEVRAMIGTLDRRINVEDVSMAMVRFENGAMGSVVNSILCPNQVTHIRWDFQKATTEVSGLYGYANADWTFTPAPALKDSPELARWRDIGPDVPVGHGAQIAATLDAIDSGRRPPVSGPEARRALEFITCLYKSAVTGASVKRGSIGKDDPFYRHVAGTLAQAEKV